ncbi:Glutathione S-transferase kappa [Lachnellula suecica]|uniref:Glutathione S-transferase kappa n=1 Tax=Lachnellula suecica TaxID=602035 RepID=A0A8T9CIM1_9HELO|nr:Glutathione S-transferase kappa [Lachnellula suecica]
MASPKLKLYVDTVSPFGYLAYYITRHDPIFSKCEVTYVPMLLGGVMKATGNVTPISIKNKDVWIGKERNRWAKWFGVPINEGTPEGFPPRTLEIMRTLCALTILKPGQGPLVECLDALFEAFWVRHEKTNEKEVMAGVLTKVLGQETATKVIEMAGKEGKALLAKNTDAALADGAFGLPWFVATNSKGETETFWGVDHLAQVTDHLGLDKSQKGGWKALL